MPIEILFLASKHKTSGSKYQRNKKRGDCLSFVIRLGLEPKTPTLKVLCSTD